jgi:hypothetical protein
MNSSLVIWQQSSWRFSFIEDFCRQYYFFKNAVWLLTLLIRLSHYATLVPTPVLPIFQEASTPNCSSFWKFQTDFQTWGMVSTQTDSGAQHHRLSVMVKRICSFTIKEECWLAVQLCQGSKEIAVDRMCIGDWDS